MSIAAAMHRIYSSACPSLLLRLPGDKLVFDLLMLLLVLAAFAGAALYVRACLDLTHPAQPPGGHAP